MFSFVCVCVRPCRDPSPHSPIDHDFVSLPDSVSSGEGLDVVVGIPVRVVNDDGVGRRQVDSQTASASRQQKDEVLGTARQTW